VSALRRLDLYAFFAALLTLAVVVLYLVLTRQEGGTPTLWAVWPLTIAGCGALYAAWRTSPLRRTVLVPSAMVIFFFGFLAVLSVGPPLLLASVLCIISVLKTPTKDWRDTV
jgi:hypothetical protein